jgi:hypothetical protein
MKAAFHAFLSLAVASFLLVGCSKDDNPAGSGGGNGPTYYGTFANSAESGSLTLNFSSAPKAGPATTDNILVVITISGTLKIQGGSTVSLTGTYNTVTDSLKISGGGYSFAGTLVNGDLSGTYSGPNGSGTFIAGTSVSGSITFFCGTYTETSPASGEHHGRLNIVLDGARLGVLVREDTDSSNTVLGFKEILSGTAITIYVSGTSGFPLATGTINSAKTAMSGTYNSGDEQGTWSAELCQ